MTGNLARALRGPVLLITIGLLLLLDQEGLLSFGRTWPAILIVLGLFKMIEHLGSKSA